MKNMTIFCAVLAFLSFTLVSQAQILKPVKFEKTVKKVGENDYEIILEFEIEDAWRFYVGPEEKNEEGPIFFYSEILKKENVDLEGDFKSTGNPIVGYDPVFKMELEYFEKKAVFIQKLSKQSTSKVGTVTVGIEYMVCNNERCLAPQYWEFVIDLDDAIVDKSLAPSDQLFDDEF